MKDKKADKITYWKCERFQKDHCKGRLHVSNNTGQIIKTVGHRSDKAKVDADTVVGSIKRNALDSNENTVTRVRRTMNEHPRNPYRTENLYIPTGKVQKSNEGEHFLIFDNCK